MVNMLWTVFKAATVQDWCLLLTTCATIADSLGEKFAVSNVQEILTCVQQKGIYCAENHPGKDIILGCAELYHEGKLTEDDFFHKIQYLMTEVGRHGTKKRIVWGKHPEILFWALRGYLRFGDDFVDHLSRKILMSPDLQESSYIRA